MFRDIFRRKQEQPMSENNGQATPGGEQRDSSPAPQTRDRVLNFGTIADIEAMKFNIDQARNLFLGNIQKQNDRMIQQNEEIIRLLRLAVHGPGADPRAVPVDPKQLPEDKG